MTDGERALWCAAYVYRLGQAEASVSDAVRYAADIVRQAEHELASRRSGEEQSKRAGAPVLTQDTEMMREALL